MEDQKQKFMDGVNKARELFSMRRKNQMEIARIACEVCIITRGGGHENYYSLKNFSKQSSISAKTLSNWIYVYKAIYINAPVALLEKASYSDLESASRRIRPEHTTEQAREILKQTVERHDLDSRIVRYASDLSALYYNLLKPTIWRIDHKILEEVMHYSCLVHNQLKKLSRTKKINAVNHHFTTKWSKGGLSAKKAFELDASHAGSEVGDIKLNQNDKLIYAFLSDRIHKKFTPTELGLGVFTEGTKNRRKLLALRTLEKLVTLDLAKKNIDGQYWAVRK